jgi:dipeptidyl aminopeptidase/acylaminoacyl peptidase
MLRVLLAAAALALPVASVAQTPAAPAPASKPVTVEELVRMPDYSGPVPSRNGRYLAVRIPVNGRFNLAVIDLQERTRLTLTDYSDVDVGDISFLGNDRIVFRTRKDRVEDEEERSQSLLMVSRDGKRRVTLFDPTTSPAAGGARFLRAYARLPGNDIEFLAIGNLEDGFTRDLYRVNADTGTRALLRTGRPDGSYDYLLDDEERVPRVALAAVRGSTQRTLHFRPDNKSPFREVARFDATKPGAIYPVDLTPDSRRIYVATNRDRGTMALAIFDPESGKITRTIFADARYDVSADALGGDDAATVNFDTDTEDVTSHIFRIDQPRRTAMTESGRVFQRLVDRLMPDTFNTSRRLALNRHLVTSYSSTWPSTWHLLNETDNSLEDLLASRPWLLPDRLAPLRPFELKTRDGLVIPSHYMLPRNARPGERLPTVVLLPSYPGDRLNWGSLERRTVDAQALAARGYAVVLPALRGTRGLGNRIFYAGFGSLATQSIDDVADAAAWAVTQGIAQGDRICVAGSHFGGYAALMAAARHGGSFKCVAAMAPVTDLPSLFTAPESSLSRSPTRAALTLAMVGAASPTAIAAEQSPVGIAARIKQPVLLQWDPVYSDAPEAQVVRMAEAIARAGGTVQRAGGSAAAAGKSRSDLTRELMTSLLDFIDSQIGGRR